MSVNYVEALDALDSESEDNVASQHLNSSMSKMALDDNWEVPASALHPHRYVAGDYSFQISPVPAEVRLSLKPKQKRPESLVKQKNKEFEKNAMKSVKDTRKDRDKQALQMYREKEEDQVRNEIKRLITKREESLAEVEEATKKLMNDQEMGGENRKLEAARELKTKIEAHLADVEALIQQYIISSGLGIETTFVSSVARFGGTEAAMSRIHADARMSLSERIAEANAGFDNDDDDDDDESVKAEPLHEEHAVAVDQHHVKAVRSAYAQRKPVRIDVRLGRLESMSLFAKPSKTNANEYVVGTVVNDSTEAPVPMFTVNTKSALAKAIDTWAPTMASLNIDAATCEKVAKHAFTVAQRAAQ